MLRPTRYDPGMLIVKRGDSTEKICFLKTGRIDVEVPLKNDKMRFDTLNTGSCFCVFSAFNQDKKQKFDFRAQTTCIVETISVSDIGQLQKEQLQLSDELRTLRVLIENNEKSEYDFFRYVPRRVCQSKTTEETRDIIRKKFRMAIAKFFQKMKTARAMMNLLSLHKNIDSEGVKQVLYDKMLSNNMVEESETFEEQQRKKHFKALHALD